MQSSNRPRQRFDRHRVRPQRNTVAIVIATELRWGAVLIYSRNHQIYQEFPPQEPVAQPLLSLSMVKRTIRQTAIPPKTFNPRLGQLERDTVEIFEIDRSAMVLQLRTLRNAIDEGAEEMEMVAAESVFRKSLSRTLTRSARKLHLVARDLNRLLRLVELAHVDKPPTRPEPKSEPSSPRGARDAEGE